MNPNNILQRVMNPIEKSQDKPSPEENTVRLALNDLQTRLQRRQNALESGELSIEHAAQRIKELHEQCQEFLKRKQEFDGGRRSVKTVSTSQMDAYIAEIRRRLVAKQIGPKKELLKNSNCARVTCGSYEKRKEWQRRRKNNQLYRITKTPLYRNGKRKVELCFWMDSTNLHPSSETTDDFSKIVSRQIYKQGHG